jgi:hypothetical protein
VVGTFSSTNSIVVNVVSSQLVHRYSFNESSGTDASDSIGGAVWDGTLNAGATLGEGMVTLDGSSGYVQLPAGIVSGLDEVTIEAWVNLGSPVNTWANLFAFGDSDSDSLDTTYGMGGNYITFQPHTGTGTASANLAQGFGSAGETDSVLGNAGMQTNIVEGVSTNITYISKLDGQTNLHIVVVYHPSANSETIYTNGVFAANNTFVFNNMIDPVAFAGPTYNNGSYLAYALGADPINYLGKSLYLADPTLNGSIDEFRIYNGPLNATQVAADYALGPNQLIGISTNVSLTASVSGSQVVISWPTSSALVNLMSSTTLGASAVWTPVNNGSWKSADGNYQVTIPVSGNDARFFRLQ